MFASRNPTIVSLVQLEADSTPTTVKESKSSKAAIADIAGAPIHTLLFPMRKEYSSKRIRSFGELQDAALVPDGSSDVSDDDSTVSGLSDELLNAALVPVQSLAAEALLGEWEDRFERGLFRYDVTACPSKVVPGVYGFVAQCNEGRASKKRPTEFTIDKVEQPFDNAKFNFSKAAQEEALFAFQPVRSGGAADYVQRPSVASPNLVLINVSPIEYGHVLLVPRALDHLHQVLHFLYGLRFWLRLHVLLLAVFFVILAAFVVTAAFFVAACVFCYGCIFVIGCVFSPTFQPTAFSLGSDCRVSTLKL